MQLRPLSTKEMMRLQGFKATDIPWVRAGVSEPAMAGALGNGQTLPLVMKLLAHLLYHGSQITYEQFLAMRA